MRHGIKTVAQILVLILLVTAAVVGAALCLNRMSAAQDSPKPQIHVNDATVAADTAPVQTNAPETLPPETLPPETEPTETEPAEQRFLLSFVGDCTLGSRPSHAYIDYGFAKVVGEDYSYPFRNFVEYFEQDDLTVANLEGALCDSGNYVEKAHVFRGPTAYVNILTQNSVEFVTLANNHSMDYGADGYAKTVETLENAGVSYVERDASAIVTTDRGLKVGFYGGVYYLFDEEDLVEEISALREQADVVIFAPHWGNEGSYVAVDKQIKLAYMAIDAGADIVYGCHPHVLEPIEEYHGGIIYYSLGNFCFGGNIYPDDFDTAMIQQEVFLDAEGNMRLGQTILTPANISSIPGRNNYQPVPYAAGTAEYDRVLAKLNGTFRH